MFYLFRNSSEGVLQTVGFLRSRFLETLQSLASQTAPGAKWCSAGEDGVTPLAHHRQAASRRRNFTTHVFNETTASHDQSRNYTTTANAGQPREPG